MIQANLTKSNFTLGSDCLFKLKYHKQRYPSTKQRDIAAGLGARVVEI